MTDDDVKTIREALAALNRTVGRVHPGPLVYEWMEAATPDRIGRLLARLEDAEREVEWLRNPTYKPVPPKPAKAAPMKTIEDLAREAGFEGAMRREVLMPALARFRALVRAEAMEDCARLCDARFTQRADEGLPREASNARSLAAAIRALAKPQEPGNG